MGNSKFGWHSGIIRAKEAILTGDLTYSGTLTFGDAVTTTFDCTGAAEVDGGLTLKTTTTGLTLSGAFTTGMLLSGTSTTGISVTGASGTAIKVSGTQAKGIEMIGTYSDHVIYIHPTSVASGKRAFRIGDYGTEYPIVAGEGVIRTYAKVTSGTDVSSLQFHWGFTEGATTGDLCGSQMQIESHSTTPGPKSVMVSDFIAGLDAGHCLDSGTVIQGLTGIRCRVYGDVTSTCSGNVQAIWLDSQMSCAVGGIESSILATTGGIVPDAFARFQTNSGGWANLLYFDSLMAPVTTATGSATITHKIAVYITGVGTVYIPLASGIA